MIARAPFATAGLALVLGAVFAARRRALKG